MGAVVFFLLFVVVLLICTPREDRGLALSSMLVVGAAIWLVIRVRLHSTIGDFIAAVVDLAWRHQEGILLTFGIGVIMAVPLLMIYVALSDRKDRKTAGNARKLPAPRQNNRTSRMHSR